MLGDRSHGPAADGAQPDPTRSGVVRGTGPARPEPDTGHRPGGSDPGGSDPGEFNTGEFNTDLAGSLAAPESVAREIVLRKLSAQARTRQELATELSRRNVAEETAENVLDRMEEVGLVDDAAFANSWVNSRQRRRRLSKQALSKELARKGVGRELVDAALEEVTVDDEYAAACDLARSKRASLAGLDPKVQYRRLAGALARRGFSAEICREVTSQVLQPGTGEDPLGPLVRDGP